MTGCERFEMSNEKRKKLNKYSLTRSSVQPYMINGDPCIDISICVDLSCKRTVTDFYYLLFPLVQNFLSIIAF